jgi:hypothetical protein
MNLRRWEMMLGGRSRGQCGRGKGRRGEVDMNPILVNIIDTKNLFDVVTMLYSFSP